MTWREFCKYGRRFRWMIALYVGWMLLTTWLTCSHLAFTSNHAGVRAFAIEIEWLAAPVSLLLLVVFAIALWREDSVWEASGFSRTRPVGPREQLSAKLLWMELLAFLVPASHAWMTSITAQVGVAESLAYALLNGMTWAAAGAFASGVAIVARSWREMLGVAGLHFPALLLHGFCWTLVKDQPLFFGLVYGCLLVAVFFVVVGGIRKRAPQGRSVLMLLVGHTALVPSLVGVCVLCDFEASFQKLIAKDRAESGLTVTGEVVEVREAPPWIEVRCRIALSDTQDAEAYQFEWLGREGRWRKGDEVRSMEVLEVRLGGPGDELRFHLVPDTAHHLPLEGGSVEFEVVLRLIGLRTLGEVSVLEPGSAKWVLGPGFKARVDVTNPHRPRLRYWYQPSLLRTGVAERRLEVAGDFIAHPEGVLPVVGRFPFGWREEGEKMLAVDALTGLRFLERTESTFSKHPLLKLPVAPADRSD